MKESKRMLRTMFLKESTGSPFTEYLEDEYPSGVPWNIVEKLCEKHDIELTEESWADTSNVSESPGKFGQPADPNILAQWLGY